MLRSFSKIDAHVHIVPKEIVGTVDSRFGIKRIDFGRIETSSGYVMQLAPPFFQDGSFTVDALLKTMDYYCVEKSVIMQSLCFRMNDLVAAAVNDHRDRLCGAMVLTPTSHMLEELDHWNNCGLNVIKFEMSSGMGFSSQKAFPKMKFTDSEIVALFSEAEKRRMTITIDPSRIGGQGYRTSEIEEVTSMFSNLHFVICHLGFPSEAMNESQENEWEKMVNIVRKDNVWLDCSAMPALYCNCRYPYKDAMEKVVSIIKKYGSHKLIWGSDIPGTFLNATYEEMISMFEENCGLSEEEKENLFMFNAEKAYRIQEVNK